MAYTKTEFKKRDDKMFCFSKYGFSLNTFSSRLELSTLNGLMISKLDKQTIKSLSSPFLWPCTKVTIYAKKTAGNENTYKVYFMKRS